MTGAAGVAGAGRWQSLAAALGALSGWRRWLAAAGLGAAATAALPPLHLLPLLPVALTGLVWLIDGSRGRRAAFAAGWWFGFGHFVAGLYWVSHSLLVEPEKHAWLIPFAVSCLPAYLALFTGAVALIVHGSGLRGWRRIVLFAVLWTVGEWLRGMLFTGFPWNPLALVFTLADAAIQPAAIFGVYGLSFLAALVGAAPALLGDSTGRPRWPWVAGAALLLAASWTGGALRLAAADTATVPGVVLRIVQGNIPQRLKWSPELREQHLAHYLRLSAAPAGRAGRPTHLIWPETAVPVVFNVDEPGRRRVAAVVPPGGLLLTGAIRSSGRRPLRLWNGLVAIDARADIVAIYDKFHLVPFGEYVPLRTILGPLGLEAVAGERVDFSAGPGPITLPLPGLPPASPLICYEAIFPGAVTAPGARPGWLLNVTNDAWFGTSAGPYQHFASARLRAVEEGLPLVRAANTGVSAIVDGYGRVRAELGLGRTGVLDAPLPAAMPATPFARFGQLPLVLLLAGVLATILFRSTKRAA